MRNRHIIGVDLFATWENLHRRKSVRQKLLELQYAEPLTRNSVNAYVRWRKGAEPVPKNAVRIMQEQIIGHIFSEHDGADLKRALFTDKETRREQHTTEGVEHESKQKGSTVF